MMTGGLVVSLSSNYDMTIDAQGETVAGVVETAADAGETAAKLVGRRSWDIKGKRTQCRASGVLSFVEPYKGWHPGLLEEKFTS
ncbi:hypothetical protein Tco_0729726 [Tanacetum coccineum]|uniref:Uncharacterized protein n=1 Tax=Tanacetum coccineum TaxID=301880 RepID=A0ABQ4YQ52_9ASTR